LPTRLPNKPHAKSIRARDVRPDGIGPREARETHASETIDWLALWAASIGFSAIVLAALAFFGGDDPVGASTILIGAAAIIAVALRASPAPGDRS
jgi:hypothetical protein